MNELNKIEPREILIEHNFYEAIKDKLDDFVQKSDSSLTIVNKVRDAEGLISEYFNIVSLESFGIKGLKHVIDASALVLDYAVTMQKENELSIEKIEFVNISNFAEINAITRKNLELTKNQREKQFMALFCGL